MIGTVAPTDVGWLAIAGRDGVVSFLSIGFATEAEALKRLRAENVTTFDAEVWHDAVDKISAYVSGESYGLDDVTYADPDHMTEFQAKVRQVVAAIPYGESRTYGEVAALAGRPRAARAVGTVMSRNHVPLLMPCHRVVPAGGKLGGFTGPGGVALKQKLLDLEQRANR